MHLRRNAASAVDIQNVSTVLWTAFRAVSFFSQAWPCSDGVVALYVVLLLLFLFSDAEHALNLVIVRMTFFYVRWLGTVSS